MHNKRIAEETVPEFRFDGSREFSEWQNEARAKLSLLLGLDNIKKPGDDKFTIEYTKEYEEFTEIRFTIESEEGYIETWMYENQRSLMVHCYDMRPGDTPAKPPRKDWKYASSHCRKVRELTIEGKPYTEVEFNLETGRRNQIRVHSQYIGHPIAGDKKYGAQTNPFGRLALHAKGLAFIHPWTGKTMHFTARTPKALSK